MRHQFVRFSLFFVAIAGLATARATAQETSASVSRIVKQWQTAGFHWRVSPPLLAADPKRLPESPGNPWVAVKDPSMIRVGDRWHLFCSLRKQLGGQGRIRIGYLSFRNWEEAPQQQWSLLELTDDYHGAPQVFYFAPHRKYYLIYQAADASRGIRYGPCYSTTETLDQPDSWTRPQPMNAIPAGMKAGLDYWVICDDDHAYLFYTTNNGRMWRSRTRLADFPARGWSKPQVALRGDIFEASHTYRLGDARKFLTIVEAQAGSRRYYKAYLADRLDGAWQPLAATRERPFAAPVNVQNQAASWTTSYSHGELIRAGTDERMVIDPRRLQFVFQGVSDEDRKGKNYGAIPWRLGMLEQQAAGKKEN